MTLPRGQARARLFCGIFRKELAIARLDWFIATRPKSWDHFDRKTPSDFHPTVGGTSPCSGLDRLDSSLVIVTPREHTADLVTYVPVAFATATFVSLATTTNSLLSYSQLIPQH